MESSSSAMNLFLTVLLCILVQYRPVVAFSWGSKSEAQAADPTAHSPTDVAHLLQNQALPRYPSAYHSALRELEALQSEPLCHRIAARLLVTNCQLLDGKDEATVLTDSGRQIRDFVDSYAASLAICDLQRGSFAIPRECSNFRESVLGHLPTQGGGRAQLHVTTAEIDSCLAGLGASDSAWNTWISYRHKALQFCEAARLDNERGQNILVFQRLTKIMSNLAEGVDSSLGEYMETIQAKIKRATDSIDNLEPHIQQIRNALTDTSLVISGDLEASLKRSAQVLQSGADTSVVLQTRLDTLLQSIYKAHEVLNKEQESALQKVGEKAQYELSIILSALDTTLGSATSLQKQLQLSSLHSAELQTRQENLEEGLERLTNFTNSLSIKYEDHQRHLVHAQAVTKEILDTLDTAAASTKSLTTSFYSTIKHVTISWWPYVWCPVVSLVSGSYGLSPSLLRNLALFALGEMVATRISSYQLVAFDDFSSSVNESLDESTNNLWLLQNTANQSAFP